MAAARIGRYKQPVHAKFASEIETRFTVDFDPNSSVSIFERYARVNRLESLTKRVGNFVSVRVGMAHRALGVNVADGVLWFWIGSHADYDWIIGD